MNLPPPSLPDDLLALTPAVGLQVCRQFHELVDRQEICRAMAHWRRLADTGTARAAGCPAPAADTAPGEAGDGTGTAAA